MTAQISEILQYGGETLSLYSDPLGNFLKSSASLLEFHSPSTACWRGYVGTWALESGRLHLGKLDGWRRSATGIEKMSLQDLFPGYPDGVFAHWYSGDLHSPRGALLRYVYGGYNSIYEGDLHLTVLRGGLVGEEMVSNGKAPPAAYAGPDTDWRPTLSND
jgi:hypothetical protein